VASLGNCDMKLSIEKYYFIYDFISTLDDDVAELKTIYETLTQNGLSSSEV
jgi:hypothetical protein